MTSDVERQLMRLLHGELSTDEAAHWRQRLEAEPELAARYAGMERLWSGLDLPAPAPAGPEPVAAVRRRPGGGGRRRRFGHGCGGGAESA